MNFLTVQYALKPPSSEGRHVLSHISVAKHLDVLSACLIMLKLLKWIRLLLFRQCSHLKNRNLQME